MARAKPAPAPPPGPEMTPAEHAELDDRLARMLTKPTRSEMGGRPFLLWSQRNDENGSGVMIWTPETPEELRGADLFYDAAHGLGPFAKPIAKGKPLRRGATETALIKAILADRNDETGYLVYADYLSENGNPQGDFIRLSVELEHLKPGDPGHAEKTARQQELLDAHAEAWYAPLGELGPRPELWGTFAPWMWMLLSRGVIDTVVVDRRGLLPEHADRLFAAAPFVRKLEFERGHLDAAGFAKVKQLAQIEELELSHSELTADDLELVLRAKHLTGLKTLLVNGNNIGDAGVDALVAWPGLTKLETLDLTSCELGRDGVRALARCERATNLVRLRLGGNTNELDATHNVLRSLYIKNLMELGLGGFTIDAGLADLFESSAFAKTVRHLDLASATFPPGAFAEFARCKLPALEHLKLDGVALRGIVAPAALSRMAFADTLTNLSLDACALGPAGAEALVAGRFPKLTTLDLSRNRLANRGGIALASAAKSFPALAVLKLWDNRLGPDAVTALADSKLLTNVTELDLNGNKIGPAGALALAKSKHLTKLTSLTVDEKSVGKKGKQALLARFGEGVVSWR